MMPLFLLNILLNNQLLIYLNNIIMIVDEICRYELDRDYKGAIINKLYTILYVYYECKFIEFKTSFKISEKNVTITLSIKYNNISCIIMNDNSKVNYLLNIIGIDFTKVSFRDITAIKKLVNKMFSVINKTTDVNNDGVVTTNINTLDELI